MRGHPRMLKWSSVTAESHTAGRIVWERIDPDEEKKSLANQSTFQTRHPFSDEAPCHVDGRAVGVLRPATSDGDGAARPAVRYGVPVAHPVGDDRAARSAD